MIYDEMLFNVMERIERQDGNYYREQSQTIQADLDLETPVLRRETTKRPGQTQISVSVHVKRLNIPYYKTYTF